MITNKKKKKVGLMVKYGGNEKEVNIDLHVYYEQKNLDQLMSNRSHTYLRIAPIQH